MRRAPLDAFTQAYIECALWVGIVDDNDGQYTLDDLAQEALAVMTADCAAFQRDHADDITTGTDQRAGHDFYLTRNRHGAGFWDGDWSPEVGKRLTDAAHTYGPQDLYVGDDGKVYAQ